MTYIFKNKSESETKTIYVIILYVLKCLSNKISIMIIVLILITIVSKIYIIYINKTFILVGCVYWCVKKEREREIDNPDPRTRLLIVTAHYLRTMTDRQTDSQGWLTDKAKNMIS